MRHGGLVDRLGLPLGTIGNGTGGSSAFVSAYRAAVLADGPNGYWRLGEAVGLVAVDETLTEDGSYAAAGVTYGQAGLITGDPATCVLFNGVAGNVLLTSNARWTIGTTGLLTLETWAVFSSDGVANRRLMSKEGAVTSEWIFRRTGTNRIEVSIFDNIGGVVATLQSPLAYLAASGKHHIVVTMDSVAPDLILYVDGAAVINDNTWVGVPGPNDPTAELAIAGNTASFFPGNEQEVATYALILSPAQVAAHFALG